MLEQDRYQLNPKLYTFGMIMLMLFWFFLLMAFYIVPFLVWGLHYDVPEFVIAWQLYIQDEFDLTLSNAKWFTFLTFAIPAVICMFISWLISIYIDNKIVHDIEEKEQTSVPIDQAPDKRPLLERPVGQELSFASKIFILMVVAVVILFLVEWLITSPPPNTF